MKKFDRFKQFGGWRLLKAYASLGLIRVCIKQVLRIVVFREKPIDAYRNLQHQVVPLLRQRYAKVLEASELEYNKLSLVRRRTNYVWVCWLQGIENAPELVKVCFASLKTNLNEREVVLLTESNIHEYVTLPDFIEEKYRKGIIPAAHYSDLLRLQLLIDHGGTWIDATVMCTGKNYPKDLIDSDLFVFQHLEKGEYIFRGMSNWFITSCTNNWVLMVVRDMLYTYWKDYDCVLNYFMFHQFFFMVMERHPEVAANMPRYSNAIPHYLSRRIGDEYDEQWMTELKKRTSFHKLNYRVDEKVKSEGTFYDVVIRHTIAY